MYTYIGYIYISGIYVCIYTYKLEDSRTSRAQEAVAGRLQPRARDLRRAPRGARTAIERKGNNLKVFTAFSLKAMALTVLCAPYSRDSGSVYRGEAIRGARVLLRS